jgi:hypothetical protein
MSRGTGEGEALACPRCGCPEVQVTAGRASACAPMPALAALRCPRCGNTGTRLALHGRPRVRWDDEAG